MCALKILIVVKMAYVLLTGKMLYRKLMIIELVVSDLMKNKKNVLSATDNVKWLQN